VRIAVLGVGLIGGSIGLAVRHRLGAAVIGFDPDPLTLRRALEREALDRAAESLIDAVAGAEAIFCAAPVGALPRVVAGAIAASGADTVVTDVGSTKRGLLDATSGLDGYARFIGGHPLAGAETAGVEESRDDLFDGARWYLTPTGHSDGMLFDRLHGLIAGLGARPQAIDAAAHDREMAQVSHLPHVVANVLASAAAAESFPDGGSRPVEVGRSFRDAIRVAGANPPIWADIYSSNSEALATEVDATIEGLREAVALIRTGDTDALGAWQSTARDDRRRMLEADHSSAPLVELRVAVQNRPGTVAEIALALGRAGVNIEDMSLFPAADRRTGAISLWIAGEPEAGRAAAVVAGLGHTVAPVPSADS